MAKSLAMVIPHRLGRAAARRRLQEALSYAQAQVAPYASATTFAWAGDDLNFSVTAMGATASGTASVGVSAIAIDARLPFVLAAFTPLIRGYVEGNGSAFFAEPEAGEG